MGEVVAVLFSFKMRRSDTNVPEGVIGIDLWR
jgi:hypothetical protein